MRTKIVLATLGLLLVGTVAAYAYTAVTASATITVKEALYIDSAAVSIGTTMNVCTIAPDKASATCAIDAYPGEVGTVGFDIMNQSSVPLTTTEAASSSSSDVTLTLVTPSAAVPAKDRRFFALEFAVAAGATPGPVTITVSFSR